MRRRPGAVTPAESPVATRMLQEHLRSVLDTLSEREAGIVMMYFGLLDYTVPTRISEIARFYRISPSRARRILDKAVRKLRHPSRSYFLRDFTEDGSLKLSSLDLSARYSVYSLDYRRYTEVRHLPRVRCPQHGLGPVPVSTATTCKSCPCVIFQEPTGRPRLYCSDACRQAAYRRRRAGSASEPS